MSTSIMVSYGSKTFSGLEAFMDAFYYSHLSFYASESLLGNVYNDLKAFEEALERTHSILEALHVPMHYHIRIEFRGNDQSIYRDWKLSPFAHYLLCVNGNPSNRKVALHQLKTFSLINKDSKLKS